MKAKITQKGVYDQRGTRIEVGAEVEFKGDTLPAYLVGKAVLVEGSGRAAKVAVTNPAQGGPVETGGA